MVCDQQGSKSRLPHITDELKPVIDGKLRLKRQSGVLAPSNCPTQALRSTPSPDLLLRLRFLRQFSGFHRPVVHPGEIRAKLSPTLLAHPAMSVPPQLEMEKAFVR